MRKLIDDGAIGTLERLEFSCGDLYDFGTHCIDLCNYMNKEGAAKWVIGQIDYRELKLVFGAHVENQFLVQWEYENGVQGFGASGPGAKMVGALVKAVGSQGVIEVASTDPAADKRPLRIRKHGQAAWEYLDTDGQGPHGGVHINAALADFTACLKAGRECELSSTNALKATEIIFAAYESSRTHARIDLPLKIEDHPLFAMVEAGVLKPVAAGK
jgi:UDP-N-acetylglucosamine 3-dehydrogenase